MDPFHVVWQRNAALPQGQNLHGGSRDWWTFSYSCSMQLRHLWSNEFSLLLSECIGRARSPFFETNARLHYHMLGHQKLLWRFGAEFPFRLAPGNIQREWSLEFFSSRNTGESLEQESCNYQQNLLERWLDFRVNSAYVSVKNSTVLWQRSDGASETTAVKLFRWKLHRFKCSAVSGDPLFWILWFRRLALYEDCHPIKF